MWLNEAACLGWLGSQSHLWAGDRSYCWHSATFSLELSPACTPFPPGFPVCCVWMGHFLGSL